MLFDWIIALGIIVAVELTAFYAGRMFGQWDMGTRRKANTLPYFRREYR